MLDPGGRAGPCELEVLGLQFATGLEPAFVVALEIDARATGPGQAQLAQIDEAAQLIGQPREVVGGRHLEAVQRAGPLKAEEIRLAVELLDDGTLRTVVGLGDDRQWMFPGDLATLVVGHQPRGFDATGRGPMLALRPAGKLQVDLAGFDPRPLANPQTCAAESRPAWPGRSAL